jgi:hypothetical protein
VTCILAKHELDFDMEDLDCTDELIGIARAALSATGVEVKS